MFVVWDCIRRSNLYVKTNSQSNADARCSCKTMKIRVEYYPKTRKFHRFQYHYRILPTLISRFRWLKLPSVQDEFIPFHATSLEFILTSHWFHVNSIWFTSDYILISHWFHAISHWFHVNSFGFRIEFGWIHFDFALISREPLGARLKLPNEGQRKKNQD